MMSLADDTKEFLSDELLAALKSPEDMDAYLEVRSGQEVIDAIKALIAAPSSSPGWREV